MKETCKTCGHCEPSYKGGYCAVLGKKTAYGKEACGNYVKKKRR